MEFSLTKVGSYEKLTTVELDEFVNNAGEFNSKEYRSANFKFINPETLLEELVRVSKDVSRHYKHNPLRAPKINYTVNLEGGLGLTKEVTEVVVNLINAPIKDELRFVYRFRQLLGIVSHMIVNGENNEAEKMLSSIINNIYEAYQVDCGNSNFNLEFVEHAILSAQLAGATLASLYVTTEAGDTHLKTFEVTPSTVASEIHEIIINTKTFENLQVYKEIFFLVQLPKNEFTEHKIVLEVAKNFLELPKYLEEHSLNKKSEEPLSETQLPIIGVTFNKFNQDKINETSKGILDICSTTALPLTVDNFDQTFLNRGRRLFVNKNFDIYVSNSPDLELAPIEIKLMTVKTEDEIMNIINEYKKEIYKVYQSNNRRPKVYEIKKGLYPYIMSLSESGSLKLEPFKFTEEDTKRVMASKDGEDVLVLAGIKHDKGGVELLQDPVFNSLYSWNKKSETAFSRFNEFYDKAYMYTPSEYDKLGTEEVFEELNKSKKSKMSKDNNLYLLASSGGGMNGLASLSEHSDVKTYLDLYEDTDGNLDLKLVRLLDITNAVKTIEGWYESSETINIL